MTSSDTLTLTARRRALARFSAAQVPPELSEVERAAVRETLLLFNPVSEYQTLGICAEDVATAQRALEAYATALGCPALKLDLPPRSGVVYLKFNTLKGAWYLDGYTGPSRGVLVSYHGSDADIESIDGTYGPFPLDLFD